MSIQKNTIFRLAEYFFCPQVAKVRSVAELKTEFVLKIRASFLIVNIV